MRKTFTYSSFAITSMLVILAFVTAKTYTQLAIAAALYPFVAFFAFKLFSRRDQETHPGKRKVSFQPQEVPKKENVEVVDIVDLDKRAFLKLIGATGLSFFIFSLLGRRAETLLFDRSSDSRTTPTGTTPSGEGLPTDGYRISEIDDGEAVFYGFTNQKGSWFIMKEDPEGSFRYAKGESDFGDNWKRRANLEYDYFHKVF